jgi:hypothetical protein
MRAHRPRLAAIPAALLCVAIACTATPPAPGPTGDVSGASATPITPAPGTTLAGGEALPEGCDPGRVTSRQTVAFAAEGRAWSLDPRSGRLSCLFEVTDPGPFAWGPQGDRALLGAFRIAGLEPTLSFEPPGPPPDSADWGHPVGTAVAFTRSDAAHPFKFFLETREVVMLRELPSGHYLEVTYHPSGLAIAFVLETERGQSIWISTNEGLEPQRLVFSKGGTRFSSIAFSTDGRDLLWTALHANGYVQLHAMELADRTGFTDGWRGDGIVAAGLVVAPGERWVGITTGAACADHRAVALIGGTAARPALPGEDRPTEALGWLDPTTMLVGVGGCEGGSLDLWSADPLAGTSHPLVSGVDAGASRALAPRTPARVPAPPDAAVPPTGVG